MHDHLQQLLADGLRFNPVYPPSGNSDHLPMTLCAMSGLGATDQQLSAYREDYAKILVEVEPVPPLGDWHEEIGNRGAYPALLSYFEREVASRGIESVVAEVLPGCLPAMPADAFHPIIRLGYAISFESGPEAAAALAYLVSTAVELPVSDASVDIRATMLAQVDEPLSLEGGRFFQGIAELAGKDAYPTGCASSFGACASLALDVYRGTRNFFALHMVTAAQAARVCADLVDEKAVLAALTGSLLAAHRVLGSPSFDEVMPVPEKLDREHNYKYVYACLDEYRAYGNEKYVEEVRGFRDAGLVASWAAPDITS